MAQLFSNDAETVLLAGVAAIDTTLYLVTGTGAKFQSPTGGDWELITLEDVNKTKREIVKVTARSLDQLTVVRGQEGTTAETFSAGDIVDARLTAGSLALFQGGFNPNVDEILIGTNAATLGLRTVTVGKDADADGDESVSIGYLSDAAGAGGVAVGPSSYGTGTNSVAVGKDADADGDESVSIGDAATANPVEAIAIGKGSIVAVGADKSIAIGTGSLAYELQCVAIGEVATTSFNANNATAVGANSDATKPRSIAIGAYAQAYKDDSIRIGESFNAGRADGLGAISIGGETNADGDYSVGIGYQSRANIDKTHQINGPSIARKDAGEVAGSEILHYSSQDNYIFSEEFDLTQALANDVVSISIPIGAKFYPSEVGYVVTSANTITQQPTLSFGVTGTPAALLAANTMTKTTAGGRDVFSTLLSGDGVTSLTASLVTTQGAATTLLGRVYFKGLLLEDE